MLRKALFILAFRLPVASRAAGETALPPDSLKTKVVRTARKVDHFLLKNPQKQTSNTDYIFTGDAQRKKHWDYRIKLGRGAYAVADIYQKWYFYENEIIDPTYDESIATGVEEIVAVGDKQDGGQFRILSSVLKGGQKIQLDLGGVPANEVKAHLVGLAGVVIDEQRVADDGTVQLPAHLNRGMYVLALNHNGKIQSFKVFAE